MINYCLRKKKESKFTHDLLTMSRALGGAGLNDEGSLVVTPIWSEPVHECTFVWKENV